jgi:hypothetical protein
MAPETEEGHNAFPRCGLVRYRALKGRPEALDKQSARECLVYFGPSRPIHLLEAYLAV